MGVCHSASGNAFETCAGAVVGREWPSCGEGVVRASAVCEKLMKPSHSFTGHCSAENGAPTLTPDVWR